MSNLAVGIAVGSAMSSSSSSSAAREAKKIACKSVIDGFESRAATVEQAQQYASCVRFMHPPAEQDYTGEKLILLSFLIFVVIGVIWGYFKEDTVYGGLMGTIVWMVLAFFSAIAGFIIFA